MKRGSTKALLIAVGLGLVVAAGATWWTGSGAAQRTAADPHVGSDLNRLAELLMAAQLGFERVSGRVNLHGRTELYVVPDPDLAHVQYDAVEIEKTCFAKQDVGPVVTEERRLKPNVVAAVAEQFAKDASAFILLGLASGVEVLAQISRPVSGAGQFGIARVVQLPRQHLRAFTSHRCS